MTTSDIIKNVRWCIDEESQTDAALNEGNEIDDTSMDNIIKAHIGDALRWCLLNADSDMLTDGGASTSITSTFVTQSCTCTVVGDHAEIELPENFIRLVRVRATGWNKSVSNIIEESSDEYSMLTEGTASATVDRPVVAIVRTKPMKLELWPGQTGSITISYVQNPAIESYTGDFGDSYDYDVPMKLKTAFIYYLAFLVESAYADVTKAKSMLEIAKMHVGIVNK